MRTALFISLAVAGASCFAAEPHVHGEGRMNVALEGEDLLVELRIPAMDVVGFEHAPSTDEEHRKVKAALGVFSDADRVIGLPSSADCHIEDTDVSLADIKGEDGHDDHKHGHDDKHEKHDDHDHGHKHASSEHAHDKKHDHDDHAKDEDPHSELHARYAWHCEKAGALDSIEAKVFDVLRGLEHVEAVFVGASRQVSVELERDSRVLELGN